MHYTYVLPCINIYIYIYIYLIIPTDTTGQLQLSMREVLKILKAVYKSRAFFTSWEMFKS